MKVIYYNTAYIFVSRALSLIENKAGAFLVEKRRQSGFENVQNQKTAEGDALKAAPTLETDSGIPTSTGSFVSD